MSKNKKNLEEPPVLLSTLIGLLVILGVAAAIYLSILKPKGIRLLPSLPEQKPLPSPSVNLPLKKPQAENQLSPEDNLETIQKELDETVIEDFTDDLEQIKGIIDRL